MNMAEVTNNYKKSNPILLGAVMVYMLNIICPVVDLYMPWYLTLLPVAVMIFQLFNDKSRLRKSIKILLIGIVLILFQYWFIFKRIDLFTFLLNGFITWIPCIIAVLCYSQINPKSQKMLVQFALVAMVFTSLTTIVGLRIYPSASRELASASEDLRTIYMNLNIGGFEFIYALVLSIPVVFWMINKTRGFVKILNIGILFSFLYCIYLSAYTTALLISIIILILLIYDTYSRLRSILIIGTIFFLIMAGSGALSSIFMWMSSIVDSAYVSDRLLQIGLVLQGQAIEQIDTETSNERLLLMKNAWEAFLSSPLWGHNVFSWHKNALSGHSLGLDILSSSGVLGLVFFISLFYKIYKKIFNSRFRKLIFHTRIIWIGFIILSFINPTTFPIIYLVIFTFSSIINNNKA